MCDYDDIYLEARILDLERRIKEQELQLLELNKLLSPGARNADVKPKTLKAISPIRR